MDGVIVNSEPVYQRIEKDMFRNLDIKIDAETYRTFVGLKTLEMWKWIVHQFNLTEHPADLDREEEKKYIESLQNENGMMPVAGSIQLIKLLYDHGYQLALASSNSKVAIDAVLDKFNIGKYFTLTKSGEEVKKSKPEPDIFIEAAGALDRDPEECLVIEDSSNGVKAAIRAGMKCCAYENPETGIQDLSEADLIIQDLKDITITVIENHF